jgi:general secretion pathway protein H
MSQAGYADAGDAGFTLLEVICVLAIVALLAAIALPEIPRGTSRLRLEGYAIETAALLNSDQLVARRQHRDVITSVDAPSRAVRSGVNGLTVRYPADVIVEALLATRCNNRPNEGTIRHLASGMSCGGVIGLTRNGNGFQVRMNWLTGVAEVVPVQSAL